MSRKALLLLPALGITVVAVAVGVPDGSTESTPTRTGPPATATVAKRTLTRTAKVSGDLGFGDVEGVQAPPGGGMVTWLPGETDVLQRGDTVYRVDQKRIPLLYGAVPLYRTLQPGVVGTDVTQLERNLRALGYTGFTLDKKFTAATATAVRQWQKDLGRTRTGRLDPGDAVVAEGPRRIAERVTPIGAPAAGVLLKWTATTRVVTASLETRYADLVEIGTTANLELPDGTTVPAHVTDIGTPAEDATFPVELAVAGQRKLGENRAGSVYVIIAAETRTDVLTVPITALVARPGGGYAVMSGDSYLPVRTGMFADSYVEVTGVAEGLSVGVPE